MKIQVLIAGLIAFPAFAQPNMIHLTENTKEIVLNQLPDSYWTDLGRVGDGVFMVYDRLYDVQGNLIASGLHAYNNVNGNRVPVFSGGRATFSNSEIMGIIDKSGKVIWSVQKKYGWSISSRLEGGYAVKVTSKNNLPYAEFINSNGQSVFPSLSRKCSYGDMIIPRPFVEGLAVFYDRSTGKYGFYNEKGIIVIPAKFTGAHDFSDGLAAVKDDSRNWGYIDKSGKMVIEPKFSREPGDYHAGITWAEKNDGSSEGWGERVFLNKRGEIISSGWEGDILWVGNFILAHKKNGKRGEGYILDADCHELNRIEDIELFPPVTSAFRPVVLPVSGHLLTENTLRSKDDLSVLCVSTSAFPVEGRDKYRFDLYDAGEGYFWIVGDYRKVYGLSNARGEVLVLFKKSDF